MDPAAVFDRLISIRDDERSVIEDHLYHTLGISYDHLMLDFDYYMSGAASRITPSEKVRVQSTYQLDILDFTRFLLNKNNANMIAQPSQNTFNRMKKVMSFRHVTDRFTAIRIRLV